MDYLTQKAFESATNFIAEFARPLEQAQYKYHFGTGSIESVLDELSKFQNDDGGFGNGIEPDLRMPFSSPFASSIAFQILRELEVPSDNSLVQKGLAYFERTFDSSAGGWEPMSAQSDDYPHAPWWNHQPIATDEMLDPLKRANPGAEIAGYLHHYANGKDSMFLDEVTTNIIDTFETLPDDMEEHAMMCFIRFAEMSPNSITARLLPKLKRGVQKVVGRNREAWESYGGRPLWFAPMPASLLATELADSIQRNLDYEIETQTDDGSWQPVWSWGQYEETWPMAKLEWSGWLTLRNLLAFKSWGRIQGAN
jgi:hypothetical protein